MILVYDSEGNGLREDITQTWCIVAKDYETGELWRFRPSEIREGLELLSEATTLVCHNQVGYDLPVFKKLYGWEPRKETVLHDTYIMSMLLWPDRPNPKGYSGKGGPHSVESWGYRLGRWKPEHDDWSQFSEEMLHRCTEDVEIQTLVYKELLKEMENGK